MYFEPSKKTYYRFPSMNSIYDMDSRYYFPEKSNPSEDIHLESYAHESLDREQTSHDIYS